MESKNNINHINHNHITATIILTISKRNEDKSHSNDIGFCWLLWTARSKYMLLMALNVCCTAEVTKRSPGQGCCLSSGVLGSHLVFWVKQTGIWGRKAGRITPIVRRQAAETPSGGQWREKFISVLLRAFSHLQAPFSLVHSEALCWCHGPGCRTSNREASWSWIPHIMEYGRG